MSNPDDPAYPYTTTELNGNCGTYQQVHPGLTKREAFAVAAMQGIMASQEFRFQDLPWVAIRAKEAADALLKELANGGGK